MIKTIELLRELFFNVPLSLEASLHQGLGAINCNYREADPTQITVVERQCSEAHLMKTISRFSTKLKCYASYFTTRMLP
jgi:hypothetical protein